MAPPRGGTHIPGLLSGQPKAPARAHELGGSRCELATASLRIDEGASDIASRRLLARLRLLLDESPP
jgi:hypothetical protein